MADANILVVEDEGVVALEIQSGLKSLGYGVPAMASSGEEAIKKAEETHPDLVLMDIKLKGDMDGIEAAQQIRDRLDIPVIYLTAYADERTLKRAKITEPFGYILKPFEQRELHSSIQMALYKHKIERKLKESEQWLATTLKSIGDAVISTDKKGFITFMNPVAQALTGWREKDALGKDLIEVFNIIHEETRTLTENPVAKVIRQGAVISLTNHTLIAKDGGEAPIEDSVAPIRDDKGNITGTVLVFRDITQRKQAEEALRRRTRDLGERVKELNCLYSISHLVEKQDISLQGIFEEVVDLIPPAWQYPEITCVRIILEGQIFRTNNFEETIWKQAHDIIVHGKRMGTLEVCYLEERPESDEGPFLKEERSLINAIAKQLGRTIEQKRAEQQRIQLEKMNALGTMAAGIAHELNNPMMGMLNFIQYCLEHTANDDKRYTVLQNAERETKRCVAIVENLLTFSRMEAEGEEGCQKASCADILERVFKLLSYRIEKEQVSVTKHYTEGTPEVWVRTNGIQQVFLNLINNALDSLKDSKKKEIHIDIHPEDEFVQMTVTDTGGGIAPENLQRIFEPFFTTKPPGKGTGLGLSISQSIIKEHGGEITCENKLGQGTKFKILLPIERRKTKEETKMSKRILVIDDDEAIRNSFTLALEDTGYQVDTAETGERGLEMEKNNKHDLIFLDLKMPGLNGVETLRGLRKIDKDVPIYIVTAFHQEFFDQLEGAGREGLDFGLVKKPIGYNEIALVTKGILEGASVS